MITELEFEEGKRKFKARVTEINNFYDLSNSGFLEYKDGGEVDLNKCPPITPQIYDEVFDLIAKTLPEYLNQIEQQDLEFNQDYYEEIFLDLGDLNIEDHNELHHFNIVIEEI